jgi:hypothetical protein
MFPWSYRIALILLIVSALAGCTAPGRQMYQDQDDYYEDSRLDSRHGGIMMVAIYSQPPVAG